MRSFFKTLALLMLVFLPLASLTSCSQGTQAEAERNTVQETTTTTTDPGPSKEDVTKLNTAIWVHRTNLQTLWVELTNQKTWISNTNARIAAQEAARQKKLAAQRAASNPSRSAASNPGNGQCGGNLPPCCVMQRESGGNIAAQNPTSSASGKWQFLSSTWGNYMGYPTAASAPEWVQDKRAAELWAGGAGAGHWGGGC